MLMNSSRYKHLYLKCSGPTISVMMNQKLINYIMITGNEDLTSKNDDELFMNRK